MPHRFPMKCPFCWRSIKQFVRAQGPSGDVVRCGNAGCTGNVPEEYEQDCDQYPTVAVSLLGFKEQGKTVYLDSLVEELNERRRRWPDFYCKPLGSAWEYVQGARAGRDRGDLPARTDKIPDPLLLQLRNVSRPKLPRCRLVLYDNSGNVFTDERGFEKYAQYALRSSAVLWLINPLKLDSESYRDELQRLLSRYVTLLRRNGEDPRRRALLILLTQGDMLKGRDDVPTEVLRYLDREDDPEESEDLWRELERLSGATEAWFNTKHGNFVGRARDDLGAVKYCAISALGSETCMLPTPDGASKGALQISVIRRGVMLPVFWLWAFHWLPTVRVGDDVYYSLDWALEQAAAGATVQLSKGRHFLHRSATVDRPVTLLGPDAGDAQARVLRRGDGPVLRFHGGRFVARNLSFEREGGTGDVVTIDGGEVEIHNCRFRGGRKEGAQGGHGLRLAGRTSGSVAEGEASANEGCGICVTANARPTLVANTCQDNRTAGIGYFGGAGGAARGNRCSGNGAFGIFLTGTAHPVLEENTCEKHSTAGIYYRQESSGAARGNRFAENAKADVCFAEQAHPTLDDGADGAEYRLLVSKTASPTLPETVVQSTAPAPVPSPPPAASPPSPPKQAPRGFWQRWFGRQS